MTEIEQYLNQLNDLDDEMFFEKMFEMLDGVQYTAKEKYLSGTLDKETYLGISKQGNSLREDLNRMSAMCGYWNSPDKPPKKSLLH